jgi:hypothetical protein
MEIEGHEYQSSRCVGPRTAPTFSLRRMMVRISMGKSSLLFRVMPMLSISCLSLAESHLFSAAADLHPGLVHPGLRWGDRRKVTTSPSSGSQILDLA